MFAYYHQNHLNILNPRVTLDWRQGCGSWPEAALPGHQVVLLRGKIYVAVTMFLRRDIIIGEVLSSDTELASWTSLSVPGDITNFGLGTYHSQLVLAGGWISSENKCVTDVWASDNGTIWQQSESLPPLSVACSMPAIINTGSPEYLIVTGGYDNIQPHSRVDVLIEKQWVSVQPLPKPSYRRLHVLWLTIHNGNLYVTRNSVDSVFYCRLDSLLATCFQARTSTTTQVWKLLKCPFPAHCIASYGQQLLVLKSQNRANEMFAYSPLTQSWVHVGECSIRQQKCSIVISSGELLVFGCNMRQQPKFFKAMLRGTVYVCIYTVFTYSLIYTGPTTGSGF